MGVHMVKRLSVLVVEKDPQLRGALCKSLEARGYEVLAAENREQGYDLMDEMAPDILILDDPGAERAYRFVWLDSDAPDTRVELVDLEPGLLPNQIEDLLGGRFVA
jgi:DNA-binding NarL/FixJ family response regulator